MVPPASHKLTGVRGTQDAPGCRSPAPTGLSPPVVACSNAFGSAPGGRGGAPTTPAALASGWFGLLPSRSPLLRESRLISLGRATEMFQFAHGPPVGLSIHPLVSSHHAGRVAPFGFSGLIARMQLPLNVSPVSASFFGLQRLGIPRDLSLACALLVLRWCLLACVLASSCSRTSHSCSRCTPHDVPGPHSRVPLLVSFVLSSCLGNIEVIMLFSFSMCDSAVLDR